MVHSMLQTSFFLSLLSSLNRRRGKKEGEYSVTFAWREGIAASVNVLGESTWGPPGPSPGGRPWPQHMSSVYMRRSRLASAHPPVHLRARADSGFPDSSGGRRRRRRRRGSSGKSSGGKRAASRNSRGRIGKATHGSVARSPTARWVATRAGSRGCRIWPCTTSTGAASASTSRSTTATRSPTTSSVRCTRRRSKHLSLSPFFSLPRRAFESLSRRVA